ncbi:MAG: molecular chaperone DnaJ [Rickettsiales bacterium]|nr:molecular chaperone DnaJ [Rickettsiales bacterium]
MAKRDYYEILGVARDADAETMKKAFRKRAMLHHPDRNQGDADAEKKFKELNEAYDVLKDEQKRAAYDRFGHQAFEGGMGSSAGAGAQGFDFSGSFSDIFDDLFGDFTGQRRRGAGGNGAESQQQQARARGSDLRYNLQISLEDAFKGKSQTITLSTSVACESCNGSGAEKGSEPVTCPTCTGRGKIRSQQGFFTVERTCHACQGSGKIIEKPCRKCAGSGTVRKDKTLAVNIPAGVEEGTRIRLAGEGEAGMRGGTAGDLYIFLSVKPHPLFKRDGPNIHCNVPTSMATAALGGTIEVPTIDGSKVKVTIPEGTQTGHQFRLRGKGMSVLRSPARGDMYIHTQVETPVHLNKRQKEILKEFDKNAGKDTNPESTSFLDKVRDFWEDLKE